MQILALADRSPATVQFSRLSGPWPRQRWDVWAFWAKFTDQQNESVHYYRGLNKCCDGPDWMKKEPFQNLIFVGLISCGTSHCSAVLWMGWCCSLSLLSFMFSVRVHFSPAASLTPGLLQGQECESLWWHYGWMESSRVITSERNSIHSAFKIETPHIFSINRTCLKLFITWRSC